MARKNEGDASFLIGVMLGVFAGAAIVLILAPQPQQQALQEAKATTEEIRDRVEGAAEGATQ